MTWKLEGLNGVVERMRALPLKLQQKGARTAMRKAANLVAEATRAGARRIDDSATAESIEKNIAVRFSSRRLKTTGDIMFRVGVLGGAKQYANTKANIRGGRAGRTYKTDGDKSNPGGDTFYWRFVEFGTSRASAQPFMRPALSQNVGAAIDAAVSELNKAIDRSIKRHGTG